MDKSSKPPGTRQSQHAQLLRDSLINSPVVTRRIASSHRPLRPNPQGCSQEHVPLWRQLLGNLGPGKARAGVEPGRGWGQGFPSNLTWADALPLLPGTVLRGTLGWQTGLGCFQKPQGRSGSPSHPAGTFHTPGPRSGARWHGGARQRGPLGRVEETIES